MATALFIIDFQYSQAVQGKLPVDELKKLAITILHVRNKFREQGALIVNAGWSDRLLPVVLDDEYTKESDFFESFGKPVLDDLGLIIPPQKGSLVVVKNYYSAALPDVVQRLKDRNIDKAFVCGLWEGPPSDDECCVGMTALGLKYAEFDAAIIDGATNIAIRPQVSQLPVAKRFGADPHARRKAWESEGIALNSIEKCLSLVTGPSVPATGPGTSLTGSGRFSPKP